MEIHNSEICFNTKIEAVKKVLQNIRRNGRKFCVSDIRQNQESHVISVHDRAYFSCLPLSRRAGTVCAPCAAWMPGQLAGNPNSRESACFSVREHYLQSQFWHRACQCFTIRWAARCSIQLRESSLVKEGLFFVICRNCWFRASIIFVVYMFFRISGWYSKKVLRMSTINNGNELSEFAWSFPLPLFICN